MTPFRPWIAAALASLLTVLVALWAMPADAPTDRAIDRTLEATLVVHSADGARFLGSALLWGEGRVALTNHHLLTGETQVQLTTRDDHRVLARVTAVDPARDLAQLELDEHLGPGLQAVDPPAIGSPVLAVGAPLEAGWTVTRGIVSATRQVLPAVPVRFLQHDAAINPGSSGGPLVDPQGGLIGMNTRIADGSRFYVGLSYAIPADLLTDFVAGRLRPVPQLGLALRVIHPAIGRALSQPPRQGLLVDSVEVGGAAAEAGLTAGDLLLSAAGQTLHTPGDMAMALAQPPAPPIDLTILRDGQRRTLALSLPADDPSPRAARAVPAPGPVPITDLGLTLAPDGTVQTINETGPAYVSGLSAGDVIRRIDGAAFPGPDAQVTPPTLLLVTRGQDTLHVLIDPASRRLRPLGGANAIDPDVIPF
ncbi:S1C family serine protease [Pseudooceanicola onchidii]|uniref:S1C family serine protease n=1 Tax=Pseudooceanicola onchidii TaxID=2562279 RepID=UPI0010AB48F9|nr:trypsin-like peptidase domain-containing protein [Pseudooceanicola onchidii]